MKKLTTSTSLLFFIIACASAQHLTVKSQDGLLKHSSSGNIPQHLSKEDGERKVGLDILRYFKWASRAVNQFQQRLLGIWLFLFHRFCRILNGGDIPFTPLLSLRLQILSTRGT